MRSLVRYPWPGNIRELQNYVARGNPFHGWELRIGAAGKRRRTTGRDFKPYAGGQSPSRDSRGLSARELEARRSAGSRRETWLEAHHVVLQDETTRHRATCGQLARLSPMNTGRQLRKERTRV
jgi:DNA-binding NtrC family response regulator